MTKPTARAKGAATATVEENEETVIEERIAELERERASLEGPPATLSLTDIAQGAVALVDRHEQRRSTVERLLAALKIKRLEIQRSRYEREREPFAAAREAAGQRLQELEAQRIALQEEIDDGRFEWSDANTRVLSIESHIRRIDREIKALGSHGHDGGTAA
jgi:hypothetical protein